MSAMRNNFIYSGLFTYPSRLSQPIRPTTSAYTNNPSCSTVFCRSLPCVSNLICPLPAPSSPSQLVQPTNPTYAQHHFSQAVVFTSLPQSADPAMQFYLSPYTCLSHPFGHQTPSTQNCVPLHPKSSLHSHWIFKLKH